MPVHFSSTLARLWRNAWIESFNGRLRDELLDAWRFDALLEARVIIQDWRCDYNASRPHSAHGELIPTEFALQWTTTTNPKLHSEWTTKLISLTIAELSVMAGVITAVDPTDDDALLMERCVTTIAHSAPWVWGLGGPQMVAKSMTPRMLDPSRICLIASLISSS